MQAYFEDIISIYRIGQNGTDKLGSITSQEIENPHFLKELAPFARGGHKGVTSQLWPNVLGGHNWEMTPF